uniref:Mitochondrial ribosomal protein L48 n=1 Tax=Jaculus jaculus TaxID=51337 RepID=A0A8C5L8W4_JACJA
MSGTLGKVLGLQDSAISKHAFSLLRFRNLGENPIYSPGGVLLTTNRCYKTKPTHGIGKYKHLIQVQEISGLSATFAEIFLEILQSNLPEGVSLSVREHSEEDFKGRFKARPELEELLAKLN